MLKIILQNGTTSVAEWLDNSKIQQSAPINRHKIDEKFHSLLYPDFENNKFDNAKIDLVSDDLSKKYKAYNNHHKIDEPFCAST